MTTKINTENQTKEISDTPHHPGKPKFTVADMNDIEQIAKHNLYHSNCKTVNDVIKKNNIFLVRYVKDKNRYKVGVMIALCDGGDNGPICLGWSKTNSVQGDNFDRMLGVEIASIRAKMDDKETIPWSFRQNKEYRYHVKQFIRDLGWIILRDEL